MEQIQDIPRAPSVPLIFTDAAASKVSELMKEEENPALKLRVLFPAAAVPVSSTDSPSMRKSKTAMFRWRTVASRCWSIR